MIDKELIKEYCLEKKITFKELAAAAGMNEKGLHNKFSRGSITLRDLEKLLDILGKRLKVEDKN